MKYRAYLQSEEWSKKRQHVFSVLGEKCVFCRSNKHIHVHHKRYTSMGLSLLGKEKVGKDIIPLCSNCHFLWHKHHALKKMTKKHQRQQKQLLVMGFDIEGSIAECDRNIASKHFQDRKIYYQNRTRDISLVWRRSGVLT